MIDHDHDLCAAAETFFAAPYTCTPLGGSSGFSGSTFARVEAAGRVWCLRKWPAEVDAARLRFVHTVLRHSRARGFGGVPRLAATGNGETIVCRDGSDLDAQEWIAGAALAAPAADGAPVPNPVYPLAPERLAQLATALADFHRSTSDFSPPPVARLPPLAERLVAMGRALECQRAGIERWLHYEPDYGLRALAHAWLTLLPAALAGAAKGASAVPLETAGVVTHGDLWASHVFFEGANFSGFIDFESLAWDTPAVDMAQVILHFNGWAKRATVLDAYAARRPLTAVDLAFLPAAAILDLAGEGLWSLGTLAAAAGRPPHRDHHVSNLRTLLASLRILA